MGSFVAHEPVAPEYLSAHSPMRRLFYENIYGIFAFAFVKAACASR
jgi:hypothetical protein